MLSQAIACVQPPFFQPGNRRHIFCLRTMRLRIDEISTKRIRTEEKMRGIFFLFDYGVNDLSHLVVWIIFKTINVLMTVDASCRLLLLFLSGSLERPTSHTQLKKPLLHKEVSIQRHRKPRYSCEIHVPNRIWQLSPNPRHASARGHNESLEVHSIL